jgi:hypothetical protein
MSISELLAEYKRYAKKGVKWAKFTFSVDIRN